jgi:hypothetical protein
MCNFTCLFAEGNFTNLRFRATYIMLALFNLFYPSSRTMAPGVDSASNRNEYPMGFHGLLQG